jgi:DNA repair photolyase
MTVEYLTYQPKRVLNVHKHVDGWFWLKYTCDPYIGCEHGCEYCYSREAKYCPYDSPDLFSKKIKIKENAAELLDKELKKKKIDLIDPGFYQPVDKKYRMMRKMLEVCLKYSFPVLIIEKSPLILQDLDLLQEINKRSWTGVMWSFSEGKSGKATRVFEPHTPPPEARLKAMNKLAKAGIQQGAAYMPILPYLTDSREDLEYTIKAVRDNGGEYIVAGGLTLSDAQEERYLHFIKKEFPEVHKKYLTMYEGSYAPSGEYFKKLYETIKEICEKHRIPDRMPRPVNFFPQKLRINKKIAEHLHNKAFETQNREGNSYRFWAYLKAAWGTDEMEKDIRALYESLGVKELEKIPGVGKGISREIEIQLNKLP